MTRSTAYEALARVRDELESARFALSTIARAWHEHLAAAPTPGGRNLSLADIRRCLDNLELTYVLRLFATFEAILREFWLNGVGRTTEPDLRPLIDSIGRRRSMDAATLATTHDVRDFRNRIMHQNVQVLRFDFGQCAKSLGAYLSWLPVQW
jgi:hypothetical protein